MFNKIITLVTFTLIFTSSYSQSEYIVKTNGDTIICEVWRVAKTYVTYKVNKEKYKLLAEEVLTLKNINGDDLNSAQIYDSGYLMNRRRTKKKWQIFSLEVVGEMNLYQYISCRPTSVMSVKSVHDNNSPPCYVFYYARLADSSGGEFIDLVSIRSFEVFNGECDQFDQIVSDYTLWWRDIPRSKENKVFTSKFEQAVRFYNNCLNY